MVMSGNCAAGTWWCCSCGHFALIMLIVHNGGPDNKQNRKYHMPDNVIKYSLLNLPLVNMALVCIVSVYPSVMKCTCIADNKIEFSFVYAAHNYVCLLLAHGVPYH